MNLLAIAATSLSGLLTPTIAGQPAPAPIQTPRSVLTHSHPCAGARDDDHGPRWRQRCPAGRRAEAATGLAQLLRFRGACARAESAAEREAATSCLLNAEAELTKAARVVFGLLELAEVSAAAGRTGEADLN